MKWKSSADAVNACVLSPRTAGAMGECKFPNEICDIGAGWRKFVSH